jgi:hypothetical protein
MRVQKTSPEKAKEITQKNRHYIERYAQIHNKIYNDLKSKHEKIFHEEVLPNFDQNIQNLILKIKSNIHQEYSKK